MSSLKTLRSMRHAARPMRPLAMSVAIATVGVGLMYTFLLPRLMALAVYGGRNPPLLTQSAVSAGSWWFMASIAMGLGAAWLARANASVNQRLAARAVLQGVLLLDAAMVGLMLIGFYAVIVDIPRGYG